MTIPVIGIGAGPATDGQVLVFHDLLGIFAGHAPKFVKRFAELREQMIEGVGRLRARGALPQFPRDEHAYSIDADELAAFRRYLEQECAREGRGRSAGIGPPLRSERPPAAGGWRCSRLQAASCQ